MQTAPQRRLYLCLLISRLPGWGSPLEKVRFFSKRNTIAGSSLQIGPTTSHFCSGEATPLGAHLFKWNTSTAGKKTHPAAESVGDSHDSSQQKPGEPCGLTERTLLCIAWCLFWAGLSDRGFPWSDAAFLMVLHTTATRSWEDTSHFFQIKVDSRAYGARKRF